MNRTDLQKLATIRIREAKILFEAEEYSGSYYLAGYSIECALKACIAKSVQRYDFPNLNRVRDSFTHDISALARLANLNSDLIAARQSSSRFAAGWLSVCNWDETSRYTIWTREQADEIIEAVSRPKEGVLPWIKRRW